MEYFNKNQLEVMSNEGLVSELVNISGGDDWDGLLTKKGEVYKELLQQEILKRLNSIK